MAVSVMSAVQITMSMVTAEISCLAGIQSAQHIDPILMCVYNLTRAVHHRLPNDMRRSVVGRNQSDYEISH